MCADAENKDRQEPMLSAHSAAGRRHDNIPCHAQRTLGHGEGQHPHVGEGSIYIQHKGEHMKGSTCKQGGEHGEHPTHGERESHSRAGESRSRSVPELGVKGVRQL